MTRQDAPGRLQALVFDFDGLIIDTESTAFRAWSELYDAHGLELRMERWVECVGTDHSCFDPYQDFAQRAGMVVDREELRVRLKARQIHLTSQEALRPGVLALVQRARELGLRVAIASSSDRAWLDHHLGQLGIAAHFQVIASRDDVQRVKPAPDLYLHALRALGVDAAHAVAFEDSPNGIRAAKAAGLHCIAVPNPITAALALGEADRIVASLEELSVDALLPQPR
jgi:HAD superfamily hydrolase (TIGR01509 family)